MWEVRDGGGLGLRAVCGFERDVGVVRWRGGRDADDVEYWSLGRRLWSEGVYHRWVREVSYLGLHTRPLITTSSLSAPVDGDYVCRLGSTGRAAMYGSEWLAGSAYDRTARVGGVSSA